MAREAHVIGKITFTLRGEYQSGSEYERLDVVSYEGSSYVSRVDGNVSLPTQRSYWQPLALGAQGEIDPALSLTSHNAVANSAITAALQTKAAQTDVEAIEQTLQTKANNSDIEAIEQTLQTKANDADVVKLDGRQTINGQKKFTEYLLVDCGVAGGGGSIGIETSQGIACGYATNTNYTEIVNTRKCLSDDNGIVNKTSFFTNSDGSSKFTHRRYNNEGTTLAEDSYLRFDAKGLVFAASGTKAVRATKENEKAVYHEGNLTTSLSTNGSNLTVSVGKQTKTVDLSGVYSNKDYWFSMN